MAWRTFIVLSDVYKLKISFVTLQGSCAMAAKVVNGIASQAAEAKKRMTKEDDEGYSDF